MLRNAFGRIDVQLLLIAGSGLGQSRCMASRANMRVFPVDSPGVNVDLSGTRFSVFAAKTHGPLCSIGMQFYTSSAGMPVPIPPLNLQIIKFHGELSPMASCFCSI